MRREKKNLKNILLASININQSVFVTLRYEMSGLWQSEVCQKIPHTLLKRQCLKLSILCSPFLLKIQEETYHTHTTLTTSKGQGMIRSIFIES